MTDHAPLTDDDLAEIGRYHKPVSAGVASDGACDQCEEESPCSTVRLIAEVERLRGEVAALSDLRWRSGERP